MPIASSFRVVDEHTLSKLHETTLDILSNTGIVFRSDACLNIFLQHGARVEGHTAFISEQMVEKAIETAPSSFEWHARKDDKTITVGEQQKGIHVGLNNGVIYIQDRGQGEERRPGRLQDLINLYKLAQQSKICTIVGQIPVEPADITHPLRYLEIFKQLLVHSDKPLFGYDNWKKHGSKSVFQRAGDIFKQRLAQCPDKVIEDDIDRELEKYINQITIKQGG